LVLVAPATGFFICFKNKVHKVAVFTNRDG
jgi:hypothetical protein